MNRRFKGFFDSLVYFTREFSRLCGVALVRGRDTRGRREREKEREEKKRFIVVAMALIELAANAYACALSMKNRWSRGVDDER